MMKKKVEVTQEMVAEKLLPALTKIKELRQELAKYNDQLDVLAGEVAELHKKHADGSAAIRRQLENAEFNDTLLVQQLTENTVIEIELDRKVEERNDIVSRVECIERDLEQLIDEVATGNIIGIEEEEGYW